MRYIPSTDADRQAMLEAMGLSSIEELFKSIPHDLRLARPLDIPTPLSEQEVLRHMRTLARRNADVEDYVSFLGAGAYHQFLPPVVPVRTSRGGFLTASTPHP